MDEIFGAASAPRKARIEIIPLIDVIFFLLATFVLFTLSLDKIASVEAPMPIPGQTGEDFDTLFLQVSAEGTVYWKQGGFGTATLISTAEIPALLGDYKRRMSAPRVLIRGDKTAKFGPAVLALDEVRKAGIHEVSVETMVSETGK